MEDVESAFTIYAAEDEIIAAAMKVLVSVLQAIEDFEELCRLFARLHVTLFCALDSVNVYEDPESAV